MAPAGDRQKIDDAIDILRKVLSGPCPCASEFKNAPNTSLQDVVRQIASNEGPPYVGTTMRIAHHGQNTLTFTPDGQTNIMQLMKDVVQRTSACKIASLSLHEMIHAANNDPLKKNARDRKIESDTDKRMQRDGVEMGSQLKYKP